MPSQKLLTKISTFIPKWFWCPQILNFEDMARIWCRYRQENQEKTSNWSFLFVIYWISFRLRDVKMLHSTSSSLEESIGVGYLQVESKFQVLLSLQSIHTATPSIFQVCFSTFIPLKIVEFFGFPRFLAKPFVFRAPIERAIFHLSARATSFWYSTFWFDTPSGQCR